MVEYLFKIVSDYHMCLYVCPITWKSTFKKAVHMQKERVRELERQVHCVTLFSIESQLIAMLVSP